MCGHLVLRPAEFGAQLMQVGSGQSDGVAANGACELANSNCTSRACEPRTVTQTRKPNEYNRSEDALTVSFC
jgi:hypothetical protein